MPVALEMYVLRSTDSYRLVGGMLTGSGTAIRFLELVAKSLVDVNKLARPGRKHKLCLACEHVFGPRSEPPAAFTVHVPFASDWQHEGGYAICSPVCRRCADTKTDDELAAIACRWLGATPAPEAGVQ